MSRATPANPPHMLTRPDGRHEYVRALPTHWLAYRRLPRQLRWALPRQRPLAIAAAQALNTNFAALIRVVAQRNLGEDYILYALEEILEGHRRDQRALRHPFGELITPAALAKTGLQQGHQQLRALEASHAPIQRPVGSEELWLVLHDDGLSSDLKLLSFERYCVSLGTQDQDEARWRAAYVLEALTALRQWKKDGFLHALHPLAARTLALDQFIQQVCNVPEHPLRHRLPTSQQGLEALASLAPINHPGIRGITVTQQASGEFVLHWQATDGEPLEVGLRTTDWLLANYLLAHTGPEIISLLSRPHLLGASTTQRLRQQLAALLAPYLADLPEPVPLPSFATDDGAGLQASPQTATVVQALVGLLPASQANHLNRLLAAADAFTPPPTERSVHFGALVEQFKDAQALNGGWNNPDTLIQNYARLDALVELIGPSTPADQIQRTDIVRVRDQLRLYPRGRNLPPLADRPIKEVLASQDHPTLHPLTVQRYFALLKAVFAYAADQGFVATDPAAPVKYKVCTAPTKRNRTYTKAQLTQLLNGPVYTLTEPPLWRLDDYKFWLPLLGAFQGARLSELCQLTLGDVRETDGIWYLSFNTEGDGGKRLKTLSSERDVPLHPAVLHAGFLEFWQHRVTQAQNDRSARLFPNLHKLKNKLPGAYAGRWFLGHSPSNRGYLAACGLEGQNLTFHGLRHSFINQFRVQHLDMNIAKALVGHLDGSTTGGYGCGYPLAVRQQELNRLDYQIDLSHIHYRNYQALQEAQGDYRPRGPRHLSCSPQPRPVHWRRAVPLLPVRR